MQMVRQIIIPQEPVVTLHLPKEMVGKTVELIAFEIEPAANGNMPLTKEERLQQIEALTAPSLVDLSNFKFDRDEANNYDE
jgi:hypothetical protein